VDWLLNLLKVFATVITVAVVGGGALVGYTVWDEGPYTGAAEADAAMERLKDVDLAKAGMSYPELVKLLGEPERMAAKSELKGAVWVRWYRGAVAGYLRGDEMFSLTIRDASRTGEQPFWNKSVFRGSLHGLRIGDPVPTPARKKEIDKARDVRVSWNEAGGRVTSVSASNMRFYAVPQAR
jgi:hypothetical protein